MKIPFRSLPASTWVLTILTFACVFLIALTRISNYDIWYHLATGRYILEAGFADLDPFTYTQPDAPMYLQSWLAGVFFLGIWSLGGVEGLTIGKAVLTVALFGLLFATAGQRSGVPLRTQASAGFRKPAFCVVAAVALLLAAFGLKFRMFMRPHLIELMLLAGAIYLLDRHRWQRLPLIPALAALQIIWVNVHGSFPLGLALPVIFLAGDACDALCGRRIDLRAGAATAGICVAVLLVATCLNPLGPATLAVPFATLGRGEGLWTLGEYQPMRWAHLTGAFLQYTWGFGALAALGLTGLAAARLRGRRPAAWEIIVFFLFLVLPFLVGLRFIAEFVVVASPLVIRWWLGVLPAQPAKTRRWQAAEVAVGLMLPLVWWLALARSPIYQVGLGEKLGKFPAGAVGFLKQTRPPGPIFNSLGFGGYLMWHLPDSRVFIDGRWTVYTEEFYQTYLRAHGERSAWDEIDERFGPTVLVLEYLTDLVGRERIPHLESDPAWALVYWDPVAKVYFERVAPNAAAIARHEYFVARPTGFELGYLDAVLSNPEQLGTAVREFRRAVEDDARNAEAHQALAYLHAFGAQPDWDEALAAARRALELRPGLATAHAAACRARLGRAEPELARAECDRALALAPERGRVRSTYALLEGGAEGMSPPEANRAEAWFRRGVSLMRSGEHRDAADAFRESLLLRPDNQAAMTNLGFCLSDLGEHAQAIASFEAALAKAPRHFAARFGLALAHERLAQREQAIEEWRRYIREAPDSPWKARARRHLEELSSAPGAPGASPDARDSGS